MANGKLVYLVYDMHRECRTDKIQGSRCEEDEEKKKEKKEKKCLEKEGKKIRN